MVFVWYKMAKPQIAVRVDKPFYEEFEEYVEEHDVSQAEAARELLYDGMEEHRRKNIENTITDLDKALRADGGIPSRDEVKRLQKAMTLQTVALGGGVLYASALSSFNMPASATAIFGGIVVILLSFAAYKLLGVIKNGGTESATATPDPDGDAR